MNQMKYFFFLIIALLFQNPSYSQLELKYQLPPKDIMDLVLAKPAPLVSIDDKAEWMLLMERSDFPSIEELAEPELRIAGLRINPNNFGPSRSGSFTDLQIKNIRTKEIFRITGLPEKLRASSVQWSPDQKKFAFIHSTPNEIHLYIVDLFSRSARKVNKTPLNTVLGGSYQWAGNDQLVYRSVIPDKKFISKAEAPEGPIVQENIGKTVASRTYQDLLKNPNDADLFEFYTTSRLIRNDLTKEVIIGQPDIYRSFSVSPDKNFILVTTINKPFSYLVTAFGFPHTVKILDIQGKLLKTVATNPSREGQPIGFDDAPTYPRSFSWREDKGSTITYVQALDNGLGKSKVEYRDALYALPAEEQKPPTELFKTKRRFGGVIWGNENIAVFYEMMRGDRILRMNHFNPETGQIDSLFERSLNDNYSDIGYPMTQRNEFGEQVLIVLNGKELLLRSDGASAEGDLPFIQTFNIKNGNKKILWRNAAPYYEFVVDAIDPKNGVFLTSRESKTEPPNYFIINTKKKIAPIAITDFKNPYEKLEGVTRNKISYQRADGIDLTGDLYLPANYNVQKDGPLPVIMWAYPREYKSAADAAQVRGSKYRFTRINYGSPVFWVTQGYAVLDNAEMPIVGEGGNEPNDNFIPQLHLNAHAAIKKLAEMGVGDSNRVAVGGHSYGAFMTANLLAHTQLFKAGIARSGAYNRTLTPFGFQAEERTYWDAPEVYYNMSPFMFADKIKTPLLLVHGEMDNNSGTFPIQSERLYNAIKGHGGTVRYVVLPYESHGYSAKENILHLLWEQHQWLEQWVK